MYIYLIIGLAVSVFRLISSLSNIFTDHTYTAITVPGNDEQYFEQEHYEFKRKPHPLGMTSGVIINSQIFASSSLKSHEAFRGRLKREGGWMTEKTIEQWIEVTKDTIQLDLYKKRFNRYSEIMSQRAGGST